MRLRVPLGRTSPAEVRHLGSHMHNAGLRSSMSAHLYRKCGPHNVPGQVATAVVSSTIDQLSEPHTLRSPIFEMPKRWALLVGVDYYARGKSRPVEFGDLSACVQDVLAFEQYLRHTLHVTEIVKLTSPLDRSTPADKLPTYRNIRRELRRIADAGRPGDLVYVHYSGHGIRRNRQLPDDGGDNLSGAALVPMDVMRGGAYLTGYHLGVLVKRLVRRKMRVAVILDCCFSGRAFRAGDSSIRTSKSPYDESFLSSDAEAVADATAEEENEDVGTPATGHRNTDARLSWRVDPTSCAVLTACTVNEYAHEQGFPEGRYGLLTYFVLELLRQSRRTQLPSYEKLADHARQKCLETKFAQNPVIHGESSIEFFGERPIFQRTVCHVYPSDGKFYANIGRASGVAVGANYEIAAHQQKDRTANSAHGQRLHVTSVSEYSSTMKLISGYFDFDKASPGSIAAFLRSWALPEPTYIKMGFSPQDPRAREMKSLLRLYLGRVHNLLLVPIPKSSDPSLIISQDLEGSFKIKDKEKTLLPGIPPLSCNDLDAIEKLAYVICHLARYRAIQHQLYGSSQVSLSTSTIRLELLDLEGQAWRSDVDGTYVAAHGDKVALRFTNLCPARPVHVAIFDLNATWGIVKLYPGGPQPTEETHGSRPIEIDDLTMKVPAQLGRTSIVDIVRAYVYVGKYPPTWNELALPDLPAEAHLIDHEFPIETIEDDLGAQNARHLTRPNNSKAGSTPSVAQHGIWTTIDIKVRTSRRA